MSDIIHYCQKLYCVLNCMSFPELLRKRVRTGFSGNDILSVVSRVYSRWANSRWVAQRDNRPMNIFNKPFILKTHSSYPAECLWMLKVSECYLLMSLVYFYEYLFWIYLYFFLDYSFLNSITICIIIISWKMSTAGWTQIFPESRHNNQSYISAKFSDFAQLSPGRETSFSPVFSRYLFRSL